MGGGGGGGGRPRYSGYGCRQNPKPKVMTVAVAQLGVEAPRSQLLVEGFRGLGFRV